MTFIAIDVETANADLSSICQIGAARFECGKLVAELSVLIDPQEPFHPINTNIHGISAADVAGKPVFADIATSLLEFIGDSVCACHTSFDKNSLHKAFAKSGLPSPSIRWIDTAQVTRRTWEDLSKKGYGLANVCKKIGYEFKHHDALEDAKACGYVFLAAIKHSGIALEDWSARIKQPITAYHSKATYTPQAESEPNAEGALYGEVLVFTGALQVPRSEAAEIAKNLGCLVGKGVTKKTTLLVVGDQDLWKLAGKDKSAKHIKAEHLINQGQEIRILKESDFVSLAHIRA